MEFRRRTLLPLEDVMGCFCESIPKLSHSSLHRCLLGHGISPLPASDIKATEKGKFAPTAMGYGGQDWMGPNRQSFKNPLSFEMRIGDPVSVLGNLRCLSGFFKYCM